jgi:hypothetical protein
MGETKTHGETMIGELERFIDYLKEHIEEEHYWFDSWIDEQYKKFREKGDE